MKYIKTLVLIVLSAIIVTIDCTDPNRVCTQAEKIFYGTYKFGQCEEGLSAWWCWKNSVGNYFNTKFFKEADPDNFKEGSNCSSPGYSTSCQYIRFLTQVCGSHYKVCHTEQERKPIMKMWIKQVIRNTVYKVGQFEDDSLELKNGKCNDILEEYFDKEEIDEISDLIGPADIQQGEYGDTHIGERLYSNVTIRPMGVLAKADESGRIPIPQNKYITKDKAKDLTLPSHWKYCDWKLTQELKKTNRDVSHYNDIYEFLPELWRCDGKCNTNKGDDQAWYTKLGGNHDTYLDLNNGETKLEEYKIDLRKIVNIPKKNASDQGIHGCYIETIQYVDCEKYQHFVKDCLVPVDKCLGNIAIREVVLFAIVRKPMFKPETCYEASNANDLLSNFMLTLIFVLLH